MKTLKLRWVGQTPLLMSSDKLANPLSAEYKEMKPLTKKRSKTEDDYETIMKLEWKYLMYFDKDIGPYIPTNNIKQCMIQGATFRRLGSKFTGVIINAPSLKVKLEYKGPRDMEGLQKRFDDFQLTTSVVVSRARVMKCRPKFDGWSIQFEVIYDEADLTKEEIIQACEDAGSKKGLCGWRPACKGEYGRFTVETV
jgi:hypothetical protein